MGSFTEFNSPLTKNNPLQTFLAHTFHFYKFANTTSTFTVSAKDSQVQNAQTLNKIKEHFTKLFFIKLGTKKINRELPPLSVKSHSPVAVNRGVVNFVHFWFNYANCIILCCNEICLVWKVSIYTGYQC